MSDCYWSLFNQNDQKRFDGLKTNQAREIVKTIRIDLATNWLAWKEGTPAWIPLLQYKELFHDSSEATASNVAIGDALTRTKTTASAEGSESTEAEIRARTISDPHYRFEETLAAGSEFNSASDEDADENPEPTRTSTKSFQHLNMRAMPDPDPVTKASVPLPPKDLDSKKEAVFVLEDDSSGVLTALEEGFKADKRKSTRYRRKIDAIVEIGDGTILQTKSVDLSIGGCQLERPLPKTFRKRHVKVHLSKGGERIETLCEVSYPTDGSGATRYRFLDINRIDLLRTWLISPG